MFFSVLYLVEGIVAILHIQERQSIIFNIGNLTFLTGLIDLHHQEQEEFFYDVIDS